MPFIMLLENEQTFVLVLHFVDAAFLDLSASLLILNAAMSP